MISSTYFPEPYGVTFHDWGAIISEQLSAYGISAPINDDSWRTWVSALFEVPQLVAMNIPQSDGFENWSDWAAQFIGSVR